jgi:hypothetical protein
MSKNSIVNKKTNKIQQTISKLVLTSFKTNTPNIILFNFSEYDRIVEYEIKKK